jgi:hypothetical protein
MVTPCGSHMRSLGGDKAKRRVIILMLRGPTPKNT